MKVFLTTTLALGTICLLETNNTLEATLIAPIIAENQVILVRGGERGGMREAPGHGEIGSTAKLADVVDRADVGMSQSRG